MADKKIVKKVVKEEVVNKGAFGRPLVFTTDSPADAEKLQKATGKFPEVKGNRLYGDREYKFNISEAEAKKILEPEVKE